MHRRVVVAVLLAVLALGVASCGSSETTVTRAQLVSRIESACRVAQRTAQRRLSTARGSGAVLAEALVTYQRYVLARVEHVKVSDAAAQSDLTAVKQAGRARLAIVERARAAGANAQRAINAVQAQTEAVTRRLTAALRDLGVEGCA